MLINRENLEALYKSLSTAFQDGIALPPPADLAFMFTDFPSDTSENLYAWVDFIQGFREWVGERVWNNVRGQKFSVTNRDFECSTSIGRNDLLDNRYGIAATILKQKAAAWPLKLQQLVAEVLTGNKLCYTGKALCATNHKLGDQTLSNLVTDALSKTSFEAALVAAAAWKFANGELIKPNFTHLVVGEKLRTTAFGIVKADKRLVTVENKAGTENVGAGEEPNANFGRCQLVVLPDLSGDYDDYWFLLDCSKPIKPVARQIREVPTPKMDRDPDIVEKTGKADFFATGRAAAAPTMPWLVYGGIL